MTKNNNDDVINHVVEFVDIRLSIILPAWFRFEKRIGHEERIRESGF